MKINSGIYSFTNLINGKKYIGQSKYLNSRYREHKSELASNKHHNDYFQKAVNKYGFKNFEYEIILKCDVNKLDYWEEHYINLYNTCNRENGYNIKEAGNNSNLPHEVIEKMVLSSRGKNNKLNAGKVEQIKLERLTGMRCIDLAKKYNVTISTINKITMCKNWEYIREDLNKYLLAQQEKYINQLSEDITSLFEKGFRPNQIKNKVNCSLPLINKILGERLKQEKEREKLVINSFMNGETINDIINKYSITASQYKRITRGLKEKRDEIIYNKIVMLKSEKVMIKDIAEILNINRGTVNELCKRFNKC